ncbi:glycosyltransferase family 2 protein [soil metagenome]
MNQASNRAAAASVVICAYTEERWDDLVACVRSVEHQTPPPAEIIVVIDHNAALLERSRSTFAGVQVLENRHAQGLPGARNSGVAAAAGRYIVFLDDDARAAPDWLDRLLEPYADQRVLGVGGHIIPVWTDGDPAWFPPEFLWVVGCTYRGVPTRRAAVRNMIGASMSLRRSVFEAVGGFHSDLGRIGKRPVGCEETELCIRARQHWPDGMFVHEPSALVWHRQPAQRATWRYFWSRCYAEGRSKAVVARLVGAGDALSTERRYVRRVLPAGAIRGIADTVRRGDASGLQRTGAIFSGLFLTALGYAAGRLAAVGQDDGGRMILPEHDGSFSSPLTRPSER